MYTVMLTMFDIAVVQKNTGDTTKSLSGEVANPAVNESTLVKHCQIMTITVGLQKRQPWKPRDVQGRQAIVIRSSEVVKYGRPNQRRQDIAILGSSPEAESHSVYCRSLIENTLSLALLGELCQRIVILGFSACPAYHQNEPNKWPASKNRCGRGMSESPLPPFPF
jgi:hypothetical protein